MPRRAVNKRRIEPSNKGTKFARPLSMKKKILIADDDPGIRDIFRIVLEKAGYDLQIKEHAADILKDKFTIPDVFLVDKLLSGIDGLDICRYLKSNPRTRHISVIMISASPDIGVSATQAGADDFIEKPFDIKYLLKVIERNIHRTRTERILKRMNAS